MKFYNNDLILVGGGGHCKVLISIIKESSQYNIVGISDKQSKLGKQISGIKINYIDSQLEYLHKEGLRNAIVSVGSLGNPISRIKLYNLLKEIGYLLPVIVSNHSIINSSVSIGSGTVVMPGAVVNSGTTIGNNCIINTGSIIDHDCKIGDNVHIAPGVTLSGGVVVGNNSHIGTGASIIQNIIVSSNVVVGAGSVVVRNINESNVIVYGNPASIRKRIQK